MPYDPATLLLGIHSALIECIVCVCVCMRVLSRVPLFVIPMDCQTSLFMEFPRQEYWNGLPFPTQWTWVWVSSGSWWWTGIPGVLQSMGSQRVGYDWATELNWLHIFTKTCVRECSQQHTQCPSRVSGSLFVYLKLTQHCKSTIFQLK